MRLTALSTSVFHIASLVLLVLLAAPLSADAHPEDVRIYEEFREWLTQQPSGKDDPLVRYRAYLTERGVDSGEVERRLRVVEEQGNRLEVERWNRILTAEKPRFNMAPNAFLVRMVEGLETGRALDVGMGQGRNAIYLAQQGWRVTGFDPADQAVAVAEEQARQLGVSLETKIQRSDQFEFGSEQWDLVVLSYVAVRPLMDRLEKSLAPGGLVVIEAFHRDATDGRSIGGAVVFETNELLRLFDQFRVIHYEDTEAEADFGRQKMRVVRLAAQKK